MPQLFIQMSGAPGSGKTSIALAIARRLDAVVIDHDVVKSTLLAADLPSALAGSVSYQVLGAMAQHLLRQGCHVIFDSPCYYQELLERGQQLAQAAGATYLYIECLVEDLDELNRRLQTRSRHRSQVAGVYLLPPNGSGETGPGKELFQEWIANMKRPKSDYLVLDTTRPFAECLEEAMKYIGRYSDILKPDTRRFKP
jgi:predicted kinase